MNRCNQNQRPTLKTEGGGGNEKQALIQRERITLTSHKFDTKTNITTTVSP